MSITTTTSDHEITIPLTVTIFWETDDGHCCGNDPYAIRKPVKASYGEYEFDIGLDPENAVEDFIMAAITSGEIE